MPRPLWKGVVSFGLVTIPVGLYSAIERQGEPHFRLLHKKDASPIDYKRVCEADGVEVPWKDIVKGYEIRKGEFVALTDADFEKARVPGTQAFEIREFVRRGDLEPTYFDHPYYLAPDGRSAVKSYALLREALTETDRVGIGKIVLRQREHLGALLPLGPALVLSTLRFADELRNPKNLDLPGESAGRAKKELDLARKLIAALEADWKPTRYKDEYEAVLRDLIEKKARGEKIVAPPLERPKPVRDLVQALQQSLADPRRHLQSLPGGRPRSTKRPRRGKAA